jgi:hypothetical protein
MRLDQSAKGVNMTNYFAITPSNFFRVKNTQRFEEWCEKHGLEFWTDDVKGNVESDIPDMGTCYAISAGGSCSGWPSDEDEEGLDFGKELAAHLGPRDVALLFEAGAERLRYVTGTAVAINASGNIIVLDLLDIFDQGSLWDGPPSDHQRALSSESRLVIGRR